MYEKTRFLTKRRYKTVLARTVRPVSNPAVSFVFSVKRGKEVSIPTQTWHFKISAPSHAVEQHFFKFEVSRIPYKVRILLHIPSPYLYLPAESLDLILIYT
jgi:hypothetical protein